MRTEPVAGRYELIERIDAGGMGEVWRGYDGVLDRQVAVKLIRPDVVSTPEQADEFARRFRREARVTARIQHHGVPQVYDAVLHNPYDQVYLVMELVHGRSLRRYINPATPRPVAWAAAIGAQVATVLSHAHAVPAVHRDLKPENILVTGDGAVKLLDFGIAAILRTDVTRLTVTGTPIGTSRYMSPEQIQGARVSPRSDLYALGCVLHELLTGRYLFNVDNEFALMHQHVNTPPPSVRQLRGEVPEPLEQLIHDLLAKSPEDRPADAYEVYERLLPLLPAPGAQPPADGGGPADGTHDGLPDPTRLYRLPNAPRTRPRFQPVTPPPPTAAPAPPVAAALDEQLRAATAESDQLLEEERFTQAADALQRAIRPAATALGIEDPRILRLRVRRAAILVLGGAFRRALPEFDALAAVYARTAGPGSQPALECLRQAAHCRAELGHTTTALQQFEQVLTHVRRAAGDASPTALDLRRNIGVLLLAEGEPARARAVLQSLHDDLLLVSPRDDPDAAEVAVLLARLDLTAAR